MQTLIRKKGKLINEMQINENFKNDDKYLINDN
jgi:hypothetical protein